MSARPGGSTAAAFHTRVFTRLKKMRARSYVGVLSQRQIHALLLSFQFPSANLINGAQ